MIVSGLREVLQGMLLNTRIELSPASGAGPQALDGRSGKVSRGGVVRRSSLRNTEDTRSNILVVVDLLSIIQSFRKLLAACH